MIHIGVVQTVLRSLVRGLDDSSGSRQRDLRPTLGYLLLCNFEYSAYIILDAETPEYLTRLVLVRPYEDREHQYVLPDGTRCSKWQFVDSPLLLVPFCCIAIVLLDRRGCLARGGW
jgi:hypothetical protein